MPAPAPLTENCAAGVIARLLKARRIDRVFGLCAESVERAAALQRALAANRVGRPALLDVLVRGDAVSSDAKSGLAWAAAGRLGRGRTALARHCARLTPTAGRSGAGAALPLPGLGIAPISGAEGVAAAIPSPTAPIQASP
jgi:hypothetical protein